jgi:hypothetical protein
MLQGFHMDVAKVDRGVEYIAMGVHIRCKRLFLMFHLFFQTYVVSVFIWMLHMFYIYVASVLSGCCVCVAIVFKCFFFRCFCKCFKHMF